MKLKIISIVFTSILLVESVWAGWSNDIWIEEATASARETSVKGKILTRDISFSKMVFICEGFDANHGYRSKEFTLDSLENAVIFLKNSKGNSLKQSLLDSSYTLILVDLVNNWDDLQQQGYALGNLMQSMWSRSPKSIPIKVVGLSMGGVIASFACGVKQFYTQNPRYDNETWERDIYNTWTFYANLCLTVDAPHSGALIPTSIYNCVDFFKTAPDGEASQRYCNALRSIAADEMLINRFGGPFDPQAWLNLYKKVMATYKTTTNKTRFVGMCNGNWAGNKQFASNNNELIINWHYDPLGCGESWAKLRSDPEDILSHETFWGKWGLCYFAGNETRQPITLPSLIYSLENAPGGYENSYLTIAQSMPSSPTTKYPSHCFVPTFSASALDFNTYAPPEMRNLKALEQKQGILMEENSPIHKLYHQDNYNQQHVRGLMADRAAVDAILSEIYGTIPYSDYSFSGNLKDNSGFGHHAASQGGGSYTADRNNVAGSAYQFSGSSEECLYYGPMTNFYSAANPNAGSVSMTGWFKSSVDPTGKSMMLFGFGNTADQANFQVGVGPELSGATVFRVNGWGDPFDWRTSINPKVFFDNKWHHVAVTHNKTTRKTRLFIDGTKRDSTSSYFYNVDSNGAYTVIGNEIDRNGWRFYGSIDEFKAFPRELSSTEINDMYLGPSIQDIDGNVYTSIKIGNQVWMKENLKTTQYTNHTPVGHREYNNKSSNRSTYGALYSWNSVKTGMLAIPGWHVPTDAEWNTLNTYLGANAGGKLKEEGSVHWISPNTGATNESKFGAFPGGFLNTSGSFSGLGSIGYWWTSTATLSSSAYVYDIMYNSANLYRNIYASNWYFSVRLIKD